MCPPRKIEMQTEKRESRRKRNIGYKERKKERERERKKGEVGLTSGKGWRNKGEEESFN